MLENAAIYSNIKAEQWFRGMKGKRGIIKRYNDTFSDR
jgi:hypothetical protein